MSYATIKLFLKIIETIFSYKTKLKALNNNYKNVRYFLKFTMLLLDLYLSFVLTTCLNKKIFFICAVNLFNIIKLYSKTICQVKYKTFIVKEFKKCYPSPKFLHGIVLDKAFHRTVQNYKDL